jgi:preprotein translocase subunit SecB
MSKMPPPTTPDFMIQRVYLKDVSFESPNSPKIFLEPFEAESQLNINNDVKKLDNNIFEVTLTITVTVKTKEKTAFLVELHQAGIFAVLKPLDEKALKELLATKCPEALFPYARASISHLITQGSFPSMDLPPMDFKEMYAGQQKHADDKSKK